MQLIPWNDDAARWDDHKKFHMSLYGVWSQRLFTQFEDGSMTLRPGRIGPDCRRFYKDIGIQIVKGSDPDCPKLMMPDGRPVPKAWVKAETLVIDHDTRIVVTRRHQKRNSWVGERPPHAERASVYWPAPGLRPWGGVIFISRPQKLTKQQREQITTLRAACKAWYAFSKDTATFSRSLLRCGWTSAELLEKSFNEMDNDTRRSVALDKYKTSVVSEAVDYLMLAEG